MHELFSGYFPTQEDPVATLGGQINMLWVVIGAILVIFMQAGFALVETGFCRAKHAAHVVSTNIRHLRTRIHRVLPGRLPAVAQRARHVGLLRRPRSGRR